MHDACAFKFLLLINGRRGVLLRGEKAGVAPHGAWSFDNRLTAHWLQSWLQQLVLIRAITHASVAEAELAINSVTMTDRMGASSPLRRALAAVLVAALSRRLNARGPSCFRQLSIISKNLAGALQA